MKIIHYFVDTETGGLQPRHNPLLEICIVKRVNGRERDRFYAKIIPADSDILEPIALQKNGLKPLQWRRGQRDVYEPMTAAVMINDFFEIPKKGDGFCYLVAHNAKFDVSFIRALSDKTGMRISIPYMQIDTVHLAAALLIPMGLQNHKMDTIRDFLKISAERAHTAEKDVQDLITLYDMITPPITQHRKNKSLLSWINKICILMLRLQ